MQNEHVVMVINETLSSGRKLSNDVYKRVWCARSVVPGLSQRNGFEELGLLFFN